MIFSSIVVTPKVNTKLSLKVLQRCMEHRLVVNLLNSEFHVNKTIFLEHVICGPEVKMDPSKLDTLFQWHMPTKKKKVQVFVDFANYDS